MFLSQGGRCRSVDSPTRRARPRCGRRSAATGERRPARRPFAPTGVTGSLGAAVPLRGRTGATPAGRDGTRHRLKALFAGRWGRCSCRLGASAAFGPGGLHHPCSRAEVPIAVSGKQPAEPRSLGPRDVGPQEPARRAEVPMRMPVGFGHRNLRNMGTLPGHGRWRAGQPRAIAPGNGPGPFDRPPRRRGRRAGQHVCQVDARARGRTCLPAAHVACWSARRSGWATCHAQLHTSHWRQASPRARRRDAPGRIRSYRRSVSDSRLEHCRIALGNTHTGDLARAFFGFAQGPPVGLSPWACWSTRSTGPCSRG